MREIVIFIFFIFLYCSAYLTEKRNGENKFSNVVVILADDPGCGDPTGYNPKSKITVYNIGAQAAKTAKAMWISFLVDDKKVGEILVNYFRDSVFALRKDDW